MADHGMRTTQGTPSLFSTERLERARNLALDSLIDGMHFHEVAIKDPFEAERAYLSLCEGILDALGPPENVVIESLRPLREVVAELEERGL